MCFCAPEHALETTAIVGRGSKKHRHTHTYTNTKKKSSLLRRKRLEGKSLTSGLLCTLSKAPKGENKQKAEDDRQGHIVSPSNHDYRGDAALGNEQ